MGEAGTTPSKSMASDFHPRFSSRSSRTLGGSPASARRHAERPVGNNDQLRSRTSSSYQCERHGTYAGWAPQSRLTREITAYHVTRHLFECLFLGVKQKSLAQASTRDDRQGLSSRDFLPTSAFRPKQKFLKVAVTAEVDPKRTWSLDRLIFYSRIEIPL